MKLVFAVLLGLLLVAPVMAETATVGNPLTGIYRNDQPITINSDRLEADDATRRVRFVGQVSVRQGEFTLYAREVIIIYTEGRREIDQVEANGEVRILQGARLATGDKAILYNREGRIVLKGTAKVHQGQDFIQGDEITVYLNEDRSVVSGQQGSRVNAVIHPKKEQP